MSDVKGLSVSIYRDGSDTECKRSIIWSMKEQFKDDEPSDKDIKIVRN